MLPVMVSTHALADELSKVRENWILRAWSWRRLTILWSTKEKKASPVPASNLFPESTHPTPSSGDPA